MTRAGSLALVLAALLTACSGDAPVIDTRIEGACVATTEAVRILPSAPDFWSVGSVGVLGEYTLMVIYERYEGMTPDERVVHFAWLNGALEYVVPWTELGRSRNFVASRFVRQGNALIAWLPLVPDDTEAIPSVEKTLALYRLTPDGRVTRNGLGAALLRPHESVGISIT